jgi:thioredoxin reductase
MASWRNHMPSRTLLKSDGFASNLYDPGSAFTLAQYCREQSLPYADVGLPVPIETFVSYGVAFQKRFVPQLEQIDITAVERAGGGFRLNTKNGDVVFARRVVVAAGITHFGYIPPLYSRLPPEHLTHSSQHTDVSGFKHRRVAVIGAGASAVDLAGLLQEAGSETHLIARRAAIAFHEPSFEPRPLIQRILTPRSGLGLGWRSRLCTDAPLLFHSMPGELRRRAVQRHLGPAPGWFAKSRFVGRVASHMGTRMRQVSMRGDNVELEVDHVIAATGYRVNLQRLQFLHPDLRKQMAAVEDVPILNRNFQTSVPGLFFVGLASSNSFGPLCRFAYGAKFTAKRISRHLAACR